MQSNNIAAEIPAGTSPTNKALVSDSLELIGAITAKCDRLSLRGNEEANRALERLHDARVYLENLANRINAESNSSPG